MPSTTITHRSRVIVLAVVMAVAAVAVPLSALVYYTESRAAQQEEQRLGAIAERMMTRANHVMHESGMPLQTLDALDMAPCSNQHIAHMRLLTLNSRAVGEIGHFERGCWPAHPGASPNR